MRHIDFIMVGVENYCQFIDPKEFFFETGITVISGPNGIGKTNLLDALGYTNYGVTSKGLKGSDVVSNKVGENCHTWDKFKIRETGEIFTVDRYYSHKEHGNSVYVWKEGVKDPLETKTLEANKLIEQLTLPCKLFFNKISFGQKVKTFFTSLPQGEQRDVFRKIFPLDLYDIWYKMSDSMLKEETSNLEEIINKIRTENSLLEREKSLLDDVLQEKRQFYITKEETLRSLLKEINIKLNYQNNLSVIIQNLNENNCDERYSEVRSKISFINSKLSEINASKEEKINDLKNRSKSELSQIISELDNSMLKDEKVLISEKNTILNEYGNKLSSLDKRENDIRNKADILLNTLSSNNVNIKKLYKEVEDYRENLKESICPTCKQKIVGNSKESIKETFNEKVLELKKLELSNEECNKKSKELEKDLGIIKDEQSSIKAEMNSKVSEVEIKIDSIKSKVKNVKEEKISKTKDIFQKNLHDINLEFNNKQINLRTDLEKLKKEEENLSEFIKNRSEYENEYAIVSANVSAISKRYDDEYNKDFDHFKVESVKNNISKLKISINIREGNKSKKEQRIKILQSVKDALSPSGIPNYLIGTGIPFMNQRCADLLNDVSQGRYSIIFDPMSQTKAGEFRDKISIKTFDTRNLTTDRKQISGGQERLIDVCVLVALGDLHAKMHQVDFNILILDEIFDSLDENNILSVSNLLYLLAKEKSINIISHVHIDGIQADRYLYF